MNDVMTVERLAAATGYSERAISDALFRIVKLAKKRGATVDEDQALRGLGEVLAFARAAEEIRHRPTSSETPAGPTVEP